MKNMPILNADEPQNGDNAPSPLPLAVVFLKSHSFPPRSTPSVQRPRRFSSTELDFIHNIMSTSTSSQPDYISAELVFPTTTQQDLIIETSAKPQGQCTEFWTELKSLAYELIEYGRQKTWKKKVLTVLLCVSSVLVFYDLIFGGYIISWLETFVTWMTFHSIMAVFAFVSIFVVSTREYKN
jgi:hypothetical protein